MQTKENSNNEYDEAIRRERNAVESLNESIVLTLKPNPEFTLNKGLIYALSAAAIILGLLLCVPFNNQRRELKEFRSLVNNMNIPKTSRMTRFNFEITQLNRLKLKMDGIQKDDMITRFNQKIEKYNLKNTQL